MSVLVVHLSDIHFNTSKNPLIERADSLVNAVGSIGKSSTGCILAISGDIAYSGNLEEYIIALDFIEKLQNGIAQRLNLEKVHLAIIPGNHDCALKPENAARTRMIELLSNNPEDSKEETIVDICLSAQENFFEFMTYLEKDYLNFSNRLYYEYKFPYDSDSVMFRCLNTAWVSQLHEREGTMIYPVDRVPNEADKEASVVITMLHHPFNWLGNENARALRDRLENTSDIILTGHEHVGSRYQKVTANGPVNEYLEGGVLQDNYNDDSSHFSVIELDLEAKKQKITHFSYLDDLYRPTNSSDTDWANLQINQLRSQRKFKFDLDFERYLDDPEATFTSSRGDLGLQDIYVHPMLQEQNFDDSSKETFRSYELLIKLLDSPHIVISGSNHSGKTALAKILCRSCINEGLVPILLKGSEIGDADENRITNQIHRTFSNQYNESVLEEFKQLPPSKKIVILDDYAKLRLNTKGRRKLLEILNREFTYIVLLADDFAMRLDEIIHHNGDSLMRSFSRFRILEFGYRLRDEMAMHWLRPEDDYTTDLQQLNRRMKHVRDVLDTVLGRNFIPSYPFFILTILQLLESNTQLDTSAASYSYGYFYQTLIFRQLDSIGVNLDPSTSSTYLSEFAYHLFKSRQREVSISEMKKVHDKYCQDYKRPIEFKPTLKTLNDGLIIRANDQTVRFRYGYYYYYFVATYLHNHITDSQTKEDITSLTEKVYKEEFANILLFLTHLSKDPYIIDELLVKSQNLYSDMPPIDLDKDINFLNDLHKTVPKLVYEDRDPETVRHELAENLDKNSDLTGQEVIEPDLDEQEERDLKDILEVNKAYKMIQILGQILKNSPGAIKGERKLEVASECYKLGRRLLSKLFHLINENLDDVVLDIVARIAAKHPEAKRDELIDGVRKFLFMLTEAVGYGMIKWITHSVGSDKLEETYKQIREEDNTVATALIDVSIKFDHIATYPYDDVKELKKRLEKNIYSLGLLQILALSHMDLYVVNREMKQRVCQLLDVEFRALPSPIAIERKNT